MASYAISEVVCGGDIQLMPPSTLVKIEHPTLPGTMCDRSREIHMAKTRQEKTREGKIRQIVDRSYLEGHDKSMEKWKGRQIDGQVVGFRNRSYEVPSLQAQLIHTVALITQNHDRNVDNILVRMDWMTTFVK